MPFFPDSFHIPTVLSPESEGGALQPPEDFVVSERTDTTLTLTWDAVPEGVLVRFQAQYAGEDWSSPSEEFPVTSPFVVGDILGPDTAYDVRVRSEAGESVSEWVALTNEYTWPGTPSNCVVSDRSSDSLTVTFDLPAGGGQVRIQAQLEGGAWGSAGSAFPVASPFVVTGCLPLTSYDVRLRCEGVSGVSGWVYINGEQTLGTLPSPSTAPSATIINPPVQMSMDVGIWVGAPNSFTFDLEWFGFDTESQTWQSTEVKDSSLSGSPGGIYYCQVTCTNATGSTVAQTNSLTLPDP